MADALSRATLTGLQTVVSMSDQGQPDGPELTICRKRSLGAYLIGIMCECATLATPLTAEAEAAGVPF